MCKIKGVIRRYFDQCVKLLRRTSPQKLIQMELISKITNEKKDEAFLLKICFFHSFNLGLGNLNWGHTNWSNPILLPESIWMEKTLFEIALYSISPQLKRNKKHLEFKWSWKIVSKIEPQEIKEARVYSGSFLSII